MNRGIAKQTVGDLAVEAGCATECAYPRSNRLRPHRFCCRESQPSVSALPVCVIGALGRSLFWHREIRRAVLPYVSTKGAQV
jgi:hypothetical protein